VHFRFTRESLSRSFGCTYKWKKREFFVLDWLWSQVYFTRTIAGIEEQSEATFVKTTQSEKTMPLSDAKIINRRNNKSDYFTG